MLTIVEARAVKALEIIGENPGITKAQLSKELGILTHQFSCVSSKIKDEVIIKKSIAESCGEKFGGRVNTYYLK